MTRLDLTAVVIALVAASCCVAGTVRGGEPSGDARPNILFILSDDHAAHAVSAYGSRINRTPNIDRLARDGVLFRNCFAVNSLCAPSRASILTGTYGHVNGVRTNSGRLRPDLATFPKLLREAGYTTALIGKWHLKDPPVGFDHWCILPGQGAYFDPVMIADGQQTARYKLIHYLYDDNARELYDLKKDPDELHNVFGDPNYADAASQLQTQLTRLRTNLHAEPIAASGR